MNTPAQLHDRLNQLGINRDLRVLTDWRQKGLLPPLRRVGLGRGLGTQQVWDEDVLDQAIAVHCLLTSYARSDEALLGLWLSGYPVQSQSAQHAWLRHLELVRERKKESALRYYDDYFGLGNSWWRRLPPYIRDLPSTYSFIVQSPEWLYDDADLDGEAYRYGLAKFIEALKTRRKTKIRPSQSLNNFVDTVWEEIDFSMIFRINQSIEFVGSMSEIELDTTRESLAAIRSAIQHWFEIEGSLDRVNRTRTSTKLMKDLVGPFVSMVMIMLNRTHPDLPLVNSISTIHGFVMGVKLEDISQESDGTLQSSQRVNSEWMTVKEDLARLWRSVPQA